MGYVVAKYIRLSIEDGKSESMSIENQRLLLDGYIAAMDESDIEVMEFVDNGYSGTTLERPALQELLSLVYSGAVRCIIAKDFSRLGRDAVETGYLLEQVFPLFRTRLISITDSYDSAEHNGDTGGLGVAFKLLLSERYSHDISRKIKASKHEKAIRGEAVSKNCVYGYKKVGSRLEIDEPAAGVVRLIFNLAANGNNLNQIVGALYERKIPSISEYKNNSDDCKYIWTTLAVYSILYDEQYIGTYTAGKSKTLSVGSNKAAKIDKSDWIKIPSYHPAIISESIFRTAQENIRTKPAKRKREVGTSQRYGGIDRPLRGKVVCGCCNHKMRLSSTRNAVFQCMHTFSIYDAPCHRLRISDNDLSVIMLKSMQRQIEAVMGSDGSGVALACESETATLIAGSKKEMVKLYESLVRQEISLGEYNDAKAGFVSEIRRLEQVQSGIKLDAAKSGEVQKIKSQLKELAVTAGKNLKLTAPLVELLVDKIKIYPDGNIIVAWRFPAQSSTELFGDGIEVGARIK
jgi:DNA invertase Pin-like site-specific DNA recombinase